MRKGKNYIVKENERIRLVKTITQCYQVDTSAALDHEDGEERETMRLRIQELEGQLVTRNFQAGVSTSMQRGDGHSSTPAPVSELLQGF